MASRTYAVFDAVRRRGRGATMGLFSAEGRREPRWVLYGVGPALTSHGDGAYSFELAYKHTSSAKFAQLLGSRHRARGEAVQG